MYSDERLHILFAIWTKDEVLSEGVAYRVVEGSTIKEEEKKKQLWDSRWKGWSRAHWRADGAYPTMSLVLSAPMLVSHFRITETSPMARVVMSDPPIEVGVDAQQEAKSGSHPIKEGKISLDEKAPLSLQGLAELSLKGEPTLEAKKT